MLRAQVRKFDINYIRVENNVDLSGIQDIVSTLSSSKWSHLGELGLSILTTGMVTVKSTYSDSRLDVDKELKLVCEDFILGNSKDCLSAISSLLVRVQARSSKPFTSAGISF